MKTNTIWVNLKKVEKVKDTYFKGQFKAINENVLAGNHIIGLKFDSEQVGFVLGKEVEIDIEEVVTKKEEIKYERIPTSGLKISRAGEEVMVDDKKHIVCEIPVLESAYLLAKSIAESESVTEEKVLDAAFHRGFREMIDEFTIDEFTKDKIKKLQKHLGELSDDETEEDVGTDELPKEVADILEGLKASGADVSVKKIKIKEGEAGNVDKVKKFLGL